MCVNHFIDSVFIHIVNISAFDYISFALSHFFMLYMFECLNSPVTIYGIACLIELNNFRFTKFSKVDVDNNRLMICFLPANILMYLIPLFHLLHSRFQELVNIFLRYIRDGRNIRYWSFQSEFSVYIRVVIIVGLKFFFMTILGDFKNIW